MRNRLKTILAIAFVWGMAIQTNAQEMNKVPTVKLNNGMEMPQLGSARSWSRMMPQKEYAMQSRSGSA